MNVLDAGQAAGFALAEAARRDIHAPLPSCPAWTMADLVAHVGTFTSQFLGRMDGAATNGPWSPEVPEPAARVEWFDAIHREATAAARAWPLSMQRRWCHEMSVHRWDAERAFGEADPLDAEAAADGVEEMVERFLQPPFRKPRGDGKTLHVHATDTTGEWLLRFDPDALAWTRDHAKGDCAIRGSASDLMLFFWGRVPLQQLELFGDAAVLALLR